MTHLKGCHRSFMSYVFVSKNNEIGQKTFTNVVSDKADHLNYNLSVCYKQVHNIGFFYQSVQKNYLLQITATFRLINQFLIYSRQSNTVPLQYETPTSISILKGFKPYGLSSLRFFKVPSFKVVRFKPTRFNQQ